LATAAKPYVHKYEHIYEYKRTYFWYLNPKLSVIKLLTCHRPVFM